LNLVIQTVRDFFKFQAVTRKLLIKQPTLW